jgi:PTH1 family peptidyl-tRNA hydrolase
LYNITQQKQKTRLGFMRYNQTMKLIVGLGNYDPHYANTRHNAGFSVADAFAGTHSLQWQTKDKYKAALAEGVVAGEKIIVLKPHTYYNLSGDAVLAVKQFYKIDNADIVVVHDELALPFGTLRTRVGGSDAGNNGLKSIIATVGADVARIRIGIANELLGRQAAADFVLTRFTADEQSKMPEIKKHALELIGVFITGGFAHTTKSV